MTFCCPGAARLLVDSIMKKVSTIFKDYGYTFSDPNTVLEPNEATKSYICNQGCAEAKYLRNGDIIHTHCRTNEELCKGYFDIYVHFYEW